MIYLHGMWSYNAGPANVNRSLIENSDDAICYLKYGEKNKLFRFLESTINTLKSEVVIISPIWSMSVYVCKLAKLFGKKVIFLKHGDGNYESEMNEMQNVEHSIHQERKVQNVADMILCVSEIYADWTRNRYPEYADKISFLNNGVAFEVRKKKAKRKRSIAVAGGNRNIKKNDIVCSVVQRLNEKLSKEDPDPYVLYVFGRHYENNREFFDMPNVIYMGHMEKEEYYNQLDEMELFVINSELEPFGLVLMDALNCNCSLLVTKNTGARSIIKTEDMDIINDCYDEDELEEKIRYVMEYGNASRIQDSVDRQQSSYKQAYRNLKEICQGMTKKRAD